MELITQLEDLSGQLSEAEASLIAIRSPFGEGPERRLFIEALRGSLDAAVALVERKLPGAAYFAYGQFGGSHSAIVSRTQPKQWDAPPPKSSAALAQTQPALALCIALLRALAGTNQPPPQGPKA